MASLTKVPFSFFQILPIIWELTRTIFAYLSFFFCPSEQCRHKMADCFENLFVEVNPENPYPKNSSSTDENLLDVNFWFHCYVHATSLTWWQNRLTLVDRWRWGCLQRPLSEKGFDLFMFVEDPHHWNKNTDDTQPLCGGENISSGVGVFVWVSHHRLCFYLLIFDYDSSFSSSFFLHLTSQFWSHLSKSAPGCASDIVYLINEKSLTEELVSTADQLLSSWWGLHNCIEIDMFHPDQRQIGYS